MSLDIALLKKITEIPGAPGFENRIRNFIAQEINAFFNTSLTSYKKNNKGDAAEVEFLIQVRNGGLVPIEIKSSSKSLKSKSLDSYVNEFSPKKSPI